MQQRAVVSSRQTAPLGFKPRHRRAIRSKYQVPIVFAHHRVYVPNIEMIGLQVSRRFFRLAHGDILVPPGRTFGLVRLRHGFRHLQLSRQYRDLI